MTNQDGPNYSKINKLLKAWPIGTVAVQSFLNEHEISRQLASSYVKYGWIDRIGHGAYIRSESKASLAGALYALQEELKLQIHIGADEALEMLGLGHYISLGSEKKRWLFANNAQAIPTWFKKSFVQDYNILFSYSALFKNNWELGLQKLDIGDFSVTISGPERAIMEAIYLAPRYLSIEYVYTLMEKLRTLRPELCTELLLTCNSIKTKRLFLYLAGLSNHSWFKLIDKSKLDLGSGTRQITNNGIYIADYQIVVPDLNKHEGYGDL